MRIAHGSLGKKATLTVLVPPASPTVGDLRIFPSFSWSGKCDSSGGKPQRLHSNRLPPACCPFCQAYRHRLSGQNGNGLKSCGSHMGLSAICSANRDKSPSEASQSTEGALSPKLEAISQRTCELRKASCNTHCVRSCACGYAVQPALQIASRRFVQDGKHRSTLARGGILLDLVEKPA